MSWATSSAIVIGVHMQIRVVASVAIASLAGAFFADAVLGQGADADDPPVIAVAPGSSATEPICFKSKASGRMCVPPGGTFRECPSCPEMVVVPAGRIAIGSSKEEIAQVISENGGMGAAIFREEGPRRQVTIAKPFAVGKFTVTIR